MSERINRIFEQVISYLDINEFRVFHRMANKGGKKYAMLVRVRSDTLQAVVDINPDIVDQEDEHLYHYTAHEILHVSNAPIIQAHERVIMLVPKQYRKLAWKMLNDAEEQSTQRLSRVLGRHIQALNADADAEGEPASKSGTFDIAGVEGPAYL